MSIIIVDSGNTIKWTDTDIDKDVIFNKNEVLITLKSANNDIFEIEDSHYRETFGYADVTVPASTDADDLLDQLQAFVTGGGLAGADVVTFALSGPFVTGTNKDGLRVMQSAGTILGVVVSQGQRGNNGDNLYDINKHTPTLPITTQRNGTVGTTIYTTQANRPTIVGSTGDSGDTAILLTPMPEITTFAAGDFFTMDVDQRQAQTQDLVIQLFIQYDS